MRVAQFLSSISTPQVNTLSSFHCVQRQLSRTLHKLSKYQDSQHNSPLKNNIASLNKTVSTTLHKQLQTVAPCFTKKRNQPYRLLNLLCNHSKNKDQGEIQKLFDFMKKNQGNDSTWQERNRIGREKRLFRRNYERHTYQHPKSYHLKDREKGNFRKQVAQNVLKHKFCSFFKLQCSGCKCKLECINREFQQFLRNADLCILKGLHAIVGRGTNLDAQIKAQIMNLIQQNGKNGFTKELAGKVNELITIKFGKKVTKKYQSWAKDMYEVVDKVQKYSMKTNKIRQQSKELRLKQQNSEKISYKIKKFRSAKLSKFGSKSKIIDETQSKNKDVEIIQKQRGKLKKKTHFITNQEQGTSRSKTRRSQKSDSSLNSNLKQSYTLMMQIKRRNRVKKYNSVLQSNHRKKLKTLNTQMDELTSRSTKKKITKNYQNYQQYQSKQKEKQQNSAKDALKQSNLQQRSKENMAFQIQNQTNSADQLQNNSARSSQSSITLTGTDKVSSEEQILVEQRLKQFQNLMNMKPYRDIVERNNIEILQNLFEDNRSHKQSQRANQINNMGSPQLNQKENKQHQVQGILGSKKPNRRIRPSHFLGKKKSQNKLQFQQLQPNNISETNLQRPFTLKIQKCYEPSLKQIKSCKKIKKQGETTKKLKKLLSLNEHIHTSKIIAPSENPSISKIEEQEGKTLRKIIEEIHGNTSIIQKVEKHLCDLGMQQCIIYQQDCLLTQKRKATRIRKNIRNGFIKTCANEIEDYLKLFSEKSKLKNGEDIAEERVKHKQRDYQQHCDLLNQNELMQLLQKQRGLKFYNLKHKALESSKQRKQSLLEQCDNLQAILSSIIKLSNDQPVNNRQFLGHFESYVTQKQKTPFDFYHYLSLGDNLMLRKQQKEKYCISTPSTAKGIFLQKQLQKI